MQHNVIILDSRNKTTYWESLTIKRSRAHCCKSSYTHQLSQKKTTRKCSLKNKCSFATDWKHSTKTYFTCISIKRLDVPETSEKNFVTILGSWLLVPQFCIHMCIANTMPVHINQKEKSFLHWTDFSFVKVQSNYFFCNLFFSNTANLNFRLWCFFLFLFRKNNSSMLSEDKPFYY